MTNSSSQEIAAAVLAGPQGLDKGDLQAVLVAPPAQHDDCGCMVALEVEGGHLDVEINPARRLALLC